MRWLSMRCMPARLTASASLMAAWQERLPASRPSSREVGSRILNMGAPYVRAGAMLTSRSVRRGRDDRALHVDDIDDRQGGGHGIAPCALTHRMRAIGGGSTFRLVLQHPDRGLDP